MRGSIHSEENIVMVIVKARKERILGSCYLVNYLVQIFMGSHHPRPWKILTSGTSATSSGLPTVLPADL